MSLSKRTVAQNLTSHVAILKSFSNKYDAATNPTGFVNLAVAENSLMHDELTSYLNATAALSSHCLTYGDGGNGSCRLRSALADFINTRFHPRQPISPDHTHCTSGLTNALEGVAFALADPGEAFMLAQPFYGSFPHVIYDRPGVQTVRVPFSRVASDPFTDAEAVTAAYEAALLDARRQGTRVRGVILCNPHNPLGRCYSVDALRALMHFCNTHSLHLISDEIYALSAFDGTAIQEEDTDEEGEDPVTFTSVLSIDTTNLIDPALVHMLWGSSKDFGASGLRFGAVISPHNPDLLHTLGARGLYTLPSSACDALISKVLADTRWCDWYFAENSRRLTDAYALATRFLDEQCILYEKGGNAAFFVWIDLGEAIRQRWRLRMRVDHMWAKGKSGSQKTTGARRPARSAAASPTDTSDLPTLSNAQIMAHLIQHKVYISSGDAFGSEHPGRFRIVFSHHPDLMLEGLGRMMEAIDAIPLPNADGGTGVDENLVLATQTLSMCCYCC